MIAATRLTMMRWLGIAVATILSSVPLLAPSSIWAQAYPSKTVRLIVGFPPGGNTDIMARLVANGLTALWGQQVIVDNRPGADASIAMAIVAKSPADGYTLYLLQSGVAINPPLYKNTQFDPIKDFAPITLIGEVPSLVGIHPSVPARNLSEFIALAKARKGEISYGSTSSPTMLATELLNRTAGIETVRINFKGSAPALTALVTGEVQLVLSGVGTLLPLAKSGRVRVLAITSGKRSSLAPDIPTASESGLPGYVVSLWYGIAAPGGTPRPIIDRVNTDVRKLLADADFRARLQAQGIEPLSNTPDQFAELVRSEVVKWDKVVREAKLTVE